MPSALDEPRSTPWRKALPLLAAALLGGCGPAPQQESVDDAGAPATGEGASAAPPDAGTPAPAAEADGWKTHVASDPAVSFRYPAEPGTAYIHAVDWPPQVAVRSGPFSCTEAGSIAARAGRTERREIGGRTYCVTREVEGAAGSIYSLYAYTLSVDGKVVTFTFSLRAVQCGNYDEPRKSDCEREQASFDVDGLLDGVARSFRFAG